MTKKHRSQPEAFETIDAASLDGVTGGRLSNSGGVDTRVAAGMKGLGEAVQAAQQNILQKKQKKEAEMGQMMQFAQQRQA